MESKSFKELRESAQIGHPQAQFDLAEKYREGRGVLNLKNYKKALYWYRSAAEQGHAKAQVCLGEMYFKGRGVAIDCNKAFSLYKSAADQGCAQGYLKLAMFYFSGLVVDKNMVESLICFKKAAIHGSSAACGMLASLLIYPDIGLPNYEESCFWDIIYKHGRNDLNESQSYLDSIERNLTSNQRLQIERKASAWLQEHQVSVDE